jgi:hypothetical protein
VDAMFALRLDLVCGDMGTSDDTKSEIRKHENKLEESSKVKNVVE